MFPLIPPKYLYKGIFKNFEASLALAKDTPKIAFAPKFFLFCVPSCSIKISSIFLCSKIDVPINALDIFSLTFFLQN